MPIIMACLRGTSPETALCFPATCNARWCGTLCHHTNAARVSIPSKCNRYPRQFLTHAYCSLPSQSIKLNLQLMRWACCLMRITIICQGHGSRSESFDSSPPWWMRKRHKSRRLITVYLKFLIVHSIGTSKIISQPPLASTLPSVN